MYQGAVLWYDPSPQEKKMLMVKLTRGYLVPFHQVKYIAMSAGDVPDGKVACNEHLHPGVFVEMVDNHRFVFPTGTVEAAGKMLDRISDEIEQAKYKPLTLLDLQYIYETYCKADVHDQGDLVRS